MSKNNILFAIFAVVIFSSCQKKKLATENTSFNDNWQFVRLDDETCNTGTIENQGTDWQTQFSIDHINKKSRLTLDADTLKKEFLKLEQKNWIEVQLPHTAQLEPAEVKHQWQGVAYYRKNFRIDREAEGKKVFLEFEGAMHLADIWLNGKHIKQHVGGYTPFVIDISDVVSFTKNNRIMVRLDNRNNSLIPPGKPVEKLDFLYYGGIYRDVNLIVKEPIYITNPIEANKVAGGGVFVTFPEVTQEKALIKVQTHVKNETDVSEELLVEQELSTLNGVQIAKATETSVEIKSRSDKTVTQQIQVENPQLWHPDHPDLYLLTTIIKKGNTIIDRQQVKLGIRHLHYSRDKGFVINGEALRLVGANRHMDYPYIGNALSDRAQYRDLYRIKQAGFNTVRLGHYPQDPSVLDACDELGLLVIEPMPGWQFFNKADEFCKNTFQNIRDMIRRDRNHPSVIMWETILNESWPPAWWKDMAFKVAHEEFPGNQCFTSGDMYGYYGWDILYNDWSEKHIRPNNSDSPGFIREYGDYEFGGHYSTTRISARHGEQALVQAAWNHVWSHNKHRSQYPWTVGDAVWSMYDYNRGLADNICYSGIMDLFRLPKYSYWFYRTQMDVGAPLPDGTMPAEVFLATWWTDASSAKKVVVFGNVEEVELLVNGRSVGRQKPDQGPDTPYAADYNGRINGGNPFDGGNCRNLKHPPFTFTNVPWEAGVIEAVGYIDGLKCTSHQIGTCGEVHKLAIEIEKDGCEISRHFDTAFLYVKILDKHGNLCIDCQDEVKLEISSGAQLMSPELVRAESGIASFLVRTTGKPEMKVVAQFSEVSAEGDFSLK